MRFQNPRMTAIFISRLRYAVTALALLSMEAAAEEPLTTRCESAPLMAAWTAFGEKGKLAQFLEYAALQRIEPYKAFDNVHYVGICWVSAWLITSPKGHVLVDTLYGPYTDQLLTNIRTLGFDPNDIKLDRKPFLGPRLQVIELMTKTRQIDERMRIAWLSRLEQLFRFRQPHREPVCRKVQLDRSRAVLG